MGTVSDSAFKSVANNFSCHKTFQNDLNADTVTIGKLSNVAEMNNLNLGQYRKWVLTSDDESSPGNADYEQEVTVPYILTNGMSVKGQLQVLGDIDGLAVSDLVLSNYVRSDMVIPEVTFSQEVVVLGDIDANGTDFQTELTDFLDRERVQLSSDDTISLHLEFLGQVNVREDVNLTKLNGILASTWVRTGVEVDTVQHITARKKFDQELLVVNGELRSDNISGTDLSAKYDDAIKHDEDAEIAGPELVFVSQTKIINEVFNAQFVGKFDDDAYSFITDLKRFINNLYNFYTDNIVNALPLLVKEIEVAKKIDLGTTAYLEEAVIPAKLNVDAEPEDGLMDFNSSLVTALELGSGLYSLNFRVSNSCSLPGDCRCEETHLVSLLDPSLDHRISSQDRIFSFSLPSGTFSLRSRVDSYSQTCSLDGEEAGLVVSGVLNSVADLPLSLNWLSPGPVGTALTDTVGLCSLCPLVILTFPYSGPEFPLYQLHCGILGRRRDVGAGGLCLPGSGQCLQVRYSWFNIVQYSIVQLV